MESTVNRLQLTVILTGISFIILLILYPVTYNLKPTYAQVQSCGSATGEPKAEGLVSARSVTGNFYTTSGACIADERASFVPYETPSYDELKSKYYDQVKEGDTVTKHTELTGEQTQANIPFDGSQDHVYYISGNLVVSGNNSGGRTGIVFVDGQLKFTGNYSYGGANYGTVFITRSSVVIDPSVIRIDAVIITEGTIYTGGEFCATSSIDASQLTINGSLIALNEAAPIKFCRELPTVNNTQPAEIINHQPKYVVILRKIYSEQVRKYTEISADAPPVAPPPATAPLPPTITIQPATSVSASQAVLNAQINPNSLSTTGFFRWGSSNIACSSLPTITSSQNLGSDASPVPITQNISSLSAGTTYYFCAQAANNIGTSSSSVLSFTTVPATPVNLTANSGGPNRIYLSWTATAGTTSYKIFRCQGTTCNPTTQIGTNTSASYSDIAVDCNTAYRYNIKASNPSGDSNYSSIASATTSLCPTPSYPAPTTNDADGDTYQAGPIGVICPNGKLCDCFDTKSNVNPGVTGFFATHRGDGSFDYNCDGVQEKQFNYYSYSISTPRIHTNSSCSAPLSNPLYQPKTVSSLACGVVATDYRYGCKGPLVNVWQYEADDESEACNNWGNSCTGSNSIPANTISCR